MPSDSNELLLRWKTQIERELKIGNWTELFKSDPDGIEIQPVYTQSIANTHNLPAFNNTDCEIVYRLNDYKSTQEANALYLKALSSGATALWYHLKQKNLDALFEHIETPYLLNILEGTATELIDAGVYLKHQMPHLPRVWAMLTPTETPNSWKHQYQTFVFKLQNELPACSPMVSTEVYHARGASPAFEMAIGLSMLLEFFSELFSNIQEIVLHAAVSELFFNQLVKFRALHRIWNLWKNTHPELPNLKLSASNSLRFYSASDPDSNLLRSATAALAAKLGGVSALHLHQAYHHVSQSRPDYEHHAIAQQLLIREEMLLHHYADVSCGSYFLESYTDAMAEKILFWMHAIQTEGKGLAKALESGWVDQQLSQQAQHMDQKFWETDVKKIGINAFISPNPMPLTGKVSESVFPGLTFEIKRS